MRRLFSPLLAAALALAACAALARAAAEYNGSVSGSQTAGPGARGIVFGSRGPAQVGHVFNAVNQNGTIRFLDGQSGGRVSPQGYTQLFFLCTN